MKKDSPRGCPFFCKGLAIQKIFVSLQSAPVAEVSPNWLPERWVSGLNHRFAKPTYGSFRTTSSNLVLSALYWSTDTCRPFFVQFCRTVVAPSLWRCGEMCLSSQGGYTKLIPEKELPLYQRKITIIQYCNETFIPHCIYYNPSCFL